MNAPSDQTILRIAEQFRFPTPVCQVRAWGNGLINHTYRVYTEDGCSFLMQQINTSVYADIDGIMENIHMVTETLAGHTFTFPDGRKKPCLRLIPCRDGRLCFRDPEGNAWRVYNFIGSSYCIESADTEAQVRKVAQILGQFHYLLRDFPVTSMNPVDPNFHNPEYHYQALLDTVRRDPLGKADQVTKELAIIQAHASLFSAFNDLPAEKKLPLRVNHNDPKINNIMIDCATHEPICMVDLDTMMPGLLPYDFGDAVRSVMCTGRDNGPGTDTEAIRFSHETYAIYKEAFLAGAQDSLTPAEADSLDLGVRLILWESAMRYLADYLKGNVYLKVRYPEQNLIKARLHIRVALDLD